LASDVSHSEKIAVFEADKQREDLRVEPQHPQQHRHPDVTILVNRRLYLGHLRSDADDRV